MSPQGQQTGPEDRVVSLWLSDLRARERWHMQTGGSIGITIGLIVGFLAGQFLAFLLIH